MGSFTRRGTFRDREAFLAAVKEKLGKLMGGAAQGMSSAWEKDGAADVGRLSGFGARVELTVRESEWTCTADLPAWLPIPQSLIEQKFDEKFAELSRL